MKKHFRVLSFLLAGMLAVSCAGCSSSEKIESDDTKPAAGEANEKKDKKMEKPRAEDDFYGYVNYDQLINAEIPYGESYMSGFEDEDNRDIIPDMIKEIGSSTEKYAKGSNEQLIHDLYHQAMDYKDDGSVYKEVMDNCEKILNAGDIQELFSIWGELVRNSGARSFFGFDIMNDFRNSSRNSLYIAPAKAFIETSLEDINDDSEKCKEANNIARDMHRVMGDDYETADEKGRQMVYLGLEIAHHTDFETKETLENISKVPMSTFEEFDSIMSNLDGSAVEMFLGDVKNSTDGIYICDPEQLKTINSLITDENLDKWKTYIFTSYLYGNRDFISDSNKILKEYAPESKETIEDQAATIVESNLAYQISEVYAERFYTPELDKGIHELFDDIIDSYDELISNADWLTADTRKALLKKLHNIILNTAPEPHKVDAKDAELIRTRCGYSSS